MLKIRIRSKLAAALAVPLVALIAVSGYEATQAAGDADQVRSEAEIATVAIGPSSLTADLQNERNFTAIDLIGLTDAVTLEVSSVAEARERTDTAIAELEAFLDGRPPVIAEAFAPAFSAIESDLGSARKLWDDYEGDKTVDNQELANEFFDRFTVMTTAFFDATQSLALGVEDRTLRNGAELVDQSNRRGEIQASIARTIILDSLTDGGEAAARLDVAELNARAQTAQDRVRQLATGTYASVRDTIDRPTDIETQETIAAYLAGEPIDITALLSAITGTGGADVTSAGELASQILTDEADSLDAAAQDRRTLFLALAAGVLLLAVVISWLASRSITRPLRKLRSEAHEMAARRLPDALQEILETPLGEDVVLPELQRIEVKTRDEVHEVVDVLNDVQDRTLALAADQAVLRRNIADSFVNLGRRNQNLLDRQLEFITELEQTETEPEELESLFRLDHLATRMRRNAESLLVLAGVESPRQWSAPVSSDNVVRAALGEVEEYQRVTVRHLDERLFRGEAAAGIAHVLAELIENALHFSPPEERVEMKGRNTGDGYVLAIDDDGIGMAPDDIAQANRRLSGEESYTVAPSRYLGHYVAGNLAARFGIHVRLQDRPAGGITATVTIPSALLADEVDEPVADAAPELELEPIRSDIVGAHLREPDDSAALQVAPGAPATTVAPAPVAESLGEALGDGRLETIDTVDDLTAAIHFGNRQTEIEAARQSVSRAGDVEEAPLPQRVPGAQRPDLQPTVVRRTSDADEPPIVEAIEPAPSPDGETDASTPSTGAAFGFLAGYSAAVDNENTAASEEDR